MKALWQETAVGAMAEELSWDVGACRQGRAAAQPWQRRDASTQGFQARTRPAPTACHCRAGGDGCHWAQLPVKPVTKCHISWPDEMALGHGTESNRLGWKSRDVR